LCRDTTNFFFTPLATWTLDPASRPRFLFQLARTWNVWGPRKSVPSPVPRPTDPPRSLPLLWPVVCLCRIISCTFRPGRIRYQQSARAWISFFLSSRRGIPGRPPPPRRWQPPSSPQGHLGSVHSRREIEQLNCRKTSGAGQFFSRPILRSVSPRNGKVPACLRAQSKKQNLRRFPWFMIFFSVVLPGQPSAARAIEPAGACLPLRDPFLGERLGSPSAGPRPPLFKVLASRPPRFAPAPPVAGFLRSFRAFSFSPPGRTLGETPRDSGHGRPLPAGMGNELRIQAQAPPIRFYTRDQQNPRFGPPAPFRAGRPRCPLVRPAASSLLFAPLVCRAVDGLPTLSPAGPWRPPRRGSRFFDKKVPRVQTKNFHFSRV